MATIVSCPECKRKFKMAAEPAAGKRVKCKCGNIFAPRPVSVDSPQERAVPAGVAVNCSKCDKRLRVGDNLRGKRVKCPKCGAAIAVPADTEAVATPEEAVSRPKPLPPPVDDDFVDDFVEDRPRRERAKKRPTEDDIGDDFEEERPRRRKKRAAQGMGPYEMAAGGVAVVYFALLVMALLGTFGQKYTLDEGRGDFGPGGPKFDPNKPPFDPNNPPIPKNGFPQVPKLPINPGNISHFPDMAATTAVPIATICRLNWDDGAVCTPALRAVVS